MNSRGGQHAIVNLVFVNVPRLIQFVLTGKLEVHTQESNLLVLTYRTKTFLVGLFVNCLTVCTSFGYFFQKLCRPNECQFPSFQKTKSIRN